MIPAQFLAQRPLKKDLKLIIREFNKWYELFANEIALSTKSSELLIEIIMMKLLLGVH